MAYIQFSIKTVFASLKDKTLTLECTKEVDPDTVSTDSVILANKGSHEILLFEPKVDGKLITLHLNKTPEVNSDYNLIVQDSIEDIAGERLESALFRKIQFESEITSSIQILSPADFEVIPSPTFKWKEIGDSPVNEFRIQVAKENAFYNILYDTTVTGKTEVDLPDLEDGQYYFHIRAEHGDDVGNWSDTRTFLIRSATDKKEDSSSSDPEQTQPAEEEPNDTSTTTDSGIVIDDDITPEKKEATDTVLSLLSQPESGETPLAFSFLFDTDINPEGIGISVIRSDF